MDILAIILGSDLVIPVNNETPRRQSHTSMVSHYWNIEMGLACRICTQHRTKMKLWMYPVIPVGFYYTEKILKYRKMHIVVATLNGSGGNQKKGMASTVYTLDWIITMSQCHLLGFQSFWIIIQMGLARRNNPQHGAKMNWMVALLVSNCKDNKLPEDAYCP